MAWGGLGGLGVVWAALGWEGLSGLDCLKGGLCCFEGRGLGVASAALGCLGGTWGVLGCLGAWAVLGWLGLP